MSTLQASKSVQAANTSVSTRFPWWRIPVLLALLLLSIALYIALMNVVPPPNSFVTSSNIRGMIGIWMSNFLPYFGACALILIAKPTFGRWYRMELGIIFAGALILLVMLFPVLSVLSHDSWRYLWDARVLLHGYSPYVFAPDSRILEPLRDNYLYPLTSFHLVPTIYPPGAQAIYLISYLLAPNNIYVLKTIFLCFDMAACGALALLLKQRGLDPRRAIIYAWCPLPIVEFAIQAHVDVVTITFMVLALLCASSERRGMRILTGFLIAMAKLKKLYPILLLLVVMRHCELPFKHPTLLLSCFGTILLGYLPFLILGH